LQPLIEGMGEVQRLVCIISKGPEDTWEEGEKGICLLFPNWQESHNWFLLNLSDEIGNLWAFITLSTTIKQEWPSLECHIAAMVFKPSRTMKARKTLLFFNGKLRNRKWYKPFSLFPSSRIACVQDVLHKIMRGSKYKIAWIILTKILDWKKA
jgi:hypothetical protein